MTKRTEPDPTLSLPLSAEEIAEIERIEAREVDPTPATTGSIVVATTATPEVAKPHEATTVPGQPARRPMPFLPQDSDDMWRLAAQLAKASLVPESLRGRPEDVFVVLMTGREMGLQPMQSLASLHCVHGKVFAAAQLIMALVHMSGQCEYFLCTHSDDQSATYKTRRKGWPGDESQSLTFTIQQARDYGLLEKRGSGYKSKPAVMLRWRAASQLARDVYPEATLGMYHISEAADLEPEPEAEPAPVGLAGLKATLGVGK